MPFTSKQKQQHLNDLCEWVSEGKTVREYCRQDGAPHWTTVYDWINESEEVTLRFARAKELGEEAIAQDVLMIADTPCEGQIITDDGEKVTIRKGDMLGHRKLQIDTRLKLLAKWNPKKWGDKTVEINNTNALNVGIDAPRSETREEWLARQQEGDQNG